ncbi:hypothetical protein NDU88_001898 [Pleurodeles waltl]|uniref:Uncharacterized protein n=1 Tax=Pleurodeles waltl TaxID=8319 RepID=A0AAV7LHC5_PLEWA|nr:hypothetical protein NDU88_001898 [Pleurodeles waltl]
MVTAEIGSETVTQNVVFFKDYKSSSDLMDKSVQLPDVTGNVDADSDPLGLITQNSPGPEGDHCSRLSINPAQDASDWRCPRGIHREDDSLPRFLDDDAGTTLENPDIRVTAGTKREDGLQGGVVEEDAEEPENAESTEDQEEKADDDGRHGNSVVPRESAEQGRKEKNGDALTARHAPGGTWLTKLCDGRGADPGSEAPVGEENRYPRGTEEDSPIMTYDAEGVIKRKREDGRRERSEEKEEPRTRRSRGEETTITQEPEEERENTVAGEQSTKGEPVINQELEGEEDTVSKVIETEGETRKGKEKTDGGRGRRKRRSRERGEAEERKPPSPRSRRKSEKTLWQESRVRKENPSSTRSWRERKTPSAK